MSDSEVSTEVDYSEYEEDVFQVIDGRKFSDDEGELSFFCFVPIFFALSRLYSFLCLSFFVHQHSSFLARKRLA